MALLLKRCTVPAVMRCAVPAVQCVELDFHYPSEGIHKRWDGGYRIT